MSIANPLCSVIQPKKVMCKEAINSEKIVTIYRLTTDGRWKAKRYYPASKNKEAAVFVLDYEKFDFKSLCTTINSIDDKKMNCEAAESFFMSKIINGEDIELLLFQESLSKETPISEVHCFNSNYVRTYKYNSITHLKTDRNDYHDLKPGTYCEDFLANDNLFWKP